MAATCDVIHELWLPWKQVRHHVATFNSRYKRKRIICAKYHVNWMNGVENREEGSLDPPRLMPSISRVKCMRAELGRQGFANQGRPSNVASLGELHYFIYFISQYNALHHIQCIQCTNYP